MERQGGNESWLAWLLEPAYFPGARILVISYDAWAHETHDQGRMDKYLLGENLVHSLTTAEVGQDGRPVVLAGHGLGCLVLKEVCRRAHSIWSFKQSESKLEEFLHNTKSLFLFAPPNQGSRFADKIADLESGPLVRELLITLSNDRALLNAEFEAAGRLYNWKKCTVAETHEVMWDNFKGLVVPEASSRHSTDSFLPVGEDHRNVCRPVSRESSSFQWFVTCVGEALNDGNNIDEDCFSQELSCTVGVSIVAGRLAESLLSGDPTSHVKQLGLTGMGGIGKTTLAKTLYSKISEKFEYTCFLEDVQDMEITVKLQILQRKISDNIHRWGKPRRVEWRALIGKRVLIVLDGVASSAQGCRHVPTSLSARR